MLHKLLAPANVRRALQQRLPILSWLPRYSADDAMGDLVAGITVGLTLMPQAIAYAALAGLPSQYGLYSAFAGSFVYILLGSCKEVNIGPTALLSLLTASYTHGTSPDLAVLLCFLSGCVELLCGVFQLGFLVDFVSVPVVAGFTSAAALIIACSQLKGLLGVSFEAHGFVDTWVQLARQAHAFQPGDLALGAACVATLLSLRKLKDLKLNHKGKAVGQRHWAERALWFISTGRNAMIVVLSAAIAYALECRDMLPFKLAGHIDPGLPTVSPPPFETSWGNSTRSFTEMCSYLGSGIAVVPIVAILGNVAIAKAFASGARVDATQEMATLGLCNIVGSFFRSMPVCGSFSRSAVNNASGVRTPLGGLYTGVLVLLALSLLTPYFYYIPRATLSSVIICAVIFMVEVDTVMPIWRSNKRDLLPAFGTFIACLLLGVELGIVIGVAIDIVFLLYFNARPRISIQKIQGAACTYVLVTPGSGLLFPAVDYVRSELVRAGDAELGEATPTPTPTSKAPLVLSCVHVQRADFTAAQGLRALVGDMLRDGRRVLFVGARPHVARVLQQVLARDFVHVASEGDLPAALADILRGDPEKKESASTNSSPPEQQVVEDSSPNTDSTRLRQSDEDQLDTRF